MEKVEYLNMFRDNIVDRTFKVFEGGCYPDKVSRCFGFDYSKQCIYTDVFKVEYTLRKSQFDDVICVALEHAGLCFDEIQKTMEQCREVAKRIFLCYQDQLDYLYPDAEFNARLVFAFRGSSKSLSIACYYTKGGYDELSERELFEKRIIESDIYKQRVKEGMIIEPFIWKGKQGQNTWAKQQDLLYFLEPFISSDTGKMQWRNVDGMFSINGQLQTAVNLKKRWSDMKGFRDDIKK